MATYTLVKFKNMTPLHMGTGKENYDFSATMLQSDTLYSALAAIRVQMDANTDVETFLDSFVVSSAFPYAGDCYFLPKPQGRVDISVIDGDEYISRKKLKKLKFLESSLWNKIISGEKTEVKQAQLQGSFLLKTSDEDFDRPYLSLVNQRVTVPREEGLDAEPFFFEWTYFHENAGFYCLLDVPNEKREEIIQLFRLLGEAGIGTDRNVGGGKFEVETSQLTLPEVPSANASMLLSLYLPKKEEMEYLNLDDSKYELLLRGGYISGSSFEDFIHLRKKSVYMFNYGSIFRTTQPLKGKVVDLRPEWNDGRLHPVMRSGKPFVIPIKNG